MRCAERARSGLAPAAPVLAVDAEPGMRHFLLGGTVGLSDRRSYRRALAGLAMWLGARLLLARLLGRTGRRRELHAVERWWARGVTRHLDID